MTELRVFHCSDLHFGHPAVPEHYEAIEAFIQEKKFDVVAISGDLSQRSRSGEFQRARAFIKHAERVSKVIVIPGNHDVAWWLSPFGMGRDANVLHKYRRYINDDIEPRLNVPGASFFGLNTCHGVVRQTLTWRMRDISIIGYVRQEQLQRIAEEMAKLPGATARVIVMHHNPVRGEISRRHGLKNTSEVMNAFGDMGVDLVLCGHDHQEAVHYIEHTKKGTIICTAGTISNRARGGRPSSVNSIRISDTSIDVHTLIWSADAGTFIAGPERSFKR